MKDSIAVMSSSIKIDRIKCNECNFYNKIWNECRYFCVNDIMDGKYKKFSEIANDYGGKIPLDEHGYLQYICPVNL